MSSLLNLFLICLLINVINTSSDQSKQNKHYNKQSVYKHGSCSKFDETIKVISVERSFMQLNSKQSDHLNIASIRSVDNDVYNTQCRKNKQFKEHYQDLIELKWRFQFIESLHCIRVELVFGNVTRFKHYTNFNYYKFSYRELSKNNNFLKRQPIDESINSLTVYKANLKPYVICVSFFKNRYVRNESQNSTSTTNSTEKPLDCDEYRQFLTKDERVHDIDMCIDIDTQLHFLSTHPAEHEEMNFTETNRELLMVIFIICLSAIILSIIAFIHHVIEKPRRKNRILHALRTHIQKNTHGPNDNVNLMNSSSQAIFKPSIVVTDFSSSNTINGIKLNHEEEPKETEPMLSQFKNDLPQTYHHSDNHANNQHKVTFVIGETIIEEPATFNDSLNDSIQADNNSNNQNEESIKCVSHLLDDKPWITAPTPPTNNQRMSRNNSITSQNIQ